MVWGRSAASSSWCGLGKKRCLLKLAEFGGRAPPFAAGGEEALPFAAGIVKEEALSRPTDPSLIRQRRLIPLTKA